MNREVGLGSHALSQPSPVPNKPHGFCGCKAPRKKKEEDKIMPITSHGSLWTAERVYIYYTDLLVTLYESLWLDSV